MKILNNPVRQYLLLSHPYEVYGGQETCVYLCNMNRRERSYLSCCELLVHGKCLLNTPECLLLLLLPIALCKGRNFGFKAWRSGCGMPTFSHEAWPDDIPLISDKRSLIHSPEVNSTLKFLWMILFYSVSCSFFIPFFATFSFYAVNSLPLKFQSPISLSKCSLTLLATIIIFTEMLAPSMPSPFYYYTSSVSSHAGSLRLYSSHTLILVNTLGSFIHPSNVVLPSPIGTS